MSRYLLDTNVLSGLMRNPVGPILGRMRFVGFENVYTSVIVAAELRFGAARLGSARLLQKVDGVLSRLGCAAFEPPADRVYADLRAELERAGMPIGANDLWIAAQALLDGSVLVTDNEREFGRVPKLKVENWLRA